MSKIFLIFITLIFIGNEIYSQCNQIVITSKDDNVTLLYDKDGHLQMITGSDEDRSHTTLFQTNTIGFAMPVSQENEVNILDNHDGNYILTMQRGA